MYVVDVTTPYSYCVIVGFINWVGVVKTQFLCETLDLNTRGCNVIVAGSYICNVTTSQFPSAVDMLLLWLVHIVLPHSSPVQ